MTKYSTPSEEWLRRKALEEDGCEIGAGMPDHPLRAPDTAMTDRIDEIEFRAHREDLAIKAGYSSMVGLSVSQRLSKDRAFLLSAIRALQEENERLRLENAELSTRCKPDMFWDGDAPEELWSNPEEIAEQRWDYGDDHAATFGVMTVQRAASIPSQEYLWQRIPREGCSLNDFKLTEITDEQCMHILAAQVVGDFARAALKEQTNDR